MYDGEFSRGKKSGEGFYFFKAEKMLYRGLWSGDQLVSCTWQLQNGSRWDGLLRKHKLSDESTFCFEQRGNVQPGEWRPDGSFFTGPMSIITARF